MTDGCGDPSIATRLRPCLDRFEPFDGDGPLLPGIDTVAAPGHTPGSTVVVFSAGTERAVVLGDVAHHPVQLVEPEWETLYDVDPAMALATRRRMVRDLEGTRSVRTTAMHFPGLRFGRLLTAEGRRWWSPAPY